MAIQSWIRVMNYLRIFPYNIRFRLATVENKISLFPKYIPSRKLLLYIFIYGSNYINFVENTVSFPNVRQWIKSYLLCITFRLRIVYWFALWLVNWPIITPSCNPTATNIKPSLISKRLIIFTFIYLQSSARFTILHKLKVLLFSNIWSIHLYK